MCNCTEVRRKLIKHRYKNEGHAFVQVTEDLA